MVLDGFLLLCPLLSGAQSLRACSSLPDLAAAQLPADEVEYGGALRLRPRHAHLAQMRKITQNVIQDRDP